MPPPLRSFHFSHLSVVSSSLEPPKNLGGVTPADIIYMHVAKLCEAQKGVETCLCLLITCLCDSTGPGTQPVRSVEVRATSCSL